MVRRRVEIKAIEDSSKRHTTFTKRRCGLIKKTKEFCTKCDAEAAVITFSKAGNVFAFGHPAVDILVGRYLAVNGSVLAGEAADGDVDKGRLHGDGGIVEEEEGDVPLTEAEKKIGEAMERGSWDLAVANLGLREIDELEAEVDNIKSMVAGRAAEIAARGKCIPESGFSSGESSRG
ncbi:Agamous-like MADS-box protein [Sesamum alatum]|uniref:Agamous-like MADS-box protein n=1 Tax=Sesamum alatum TaxID=300844 RepID=A0AAE2CHS1_9LAMI|nr:Agamous-like MADS-box protein [Sesamum alatum]